MDNKFNGKGIEILLEKEDDFLKIKETLTRMGVSSKYENSLFQSCHILHKQGKYAIMHFKEMFELDGKPTTISPVDLQRRNTIAKLLEDWGLLKIVNPASVIDTLPLSQLKILSHKEKSNWTLVPKYSIGKKR